MSMANTCCISYSESAEGHHLCSQDRGREVFNLLHTPCGQKGRNYYHNCPVERACVRNGLAIVGDGSCCNCDSRIVYKGRGLQSELIVKVVRIEFADLQSRTLQIASIVLSSRTQKQC